MIELLIIIAIILIVGGVSVAFLGGRRDKNDLTNTTAQVVGLLREAQAYAIAQSSSTTWGIHFDNTSSIPFFALYSSGYSAATTKGYYRLPQTLSYVTSTVPSGKYIEVSFQEISGALTANSSTTVAIYPPNSTTIPSSTITISTAGLITF